MIRHLLSPPVLVLLVLLVLLPAASRAAPPNIVLVMTDDQGYGDLGSTGNPVISTPHLDALAAQSGSMSRFYVSPVCSPTRAALMTGRHPYRTRVIDTFKGRSMMDPDELTIAEALRPAGFTSGIFGKWHLGDNYPLRPQDNGFDEVLVHQGGGLAQPSEPLANDSRYTDPILFHNGEQVQAKGYCTDVYFDAALGFIRTAREAGKPFFAYIAPNAPHGPYHDVPDDLYQKYKSLDLTPVLEGNPNSADTVARVYAMIENIDQNMGRLTTALDELGIAENTLVVFMLDNGPNTHRYVGPFRGTKSHVHEGGIRSPFYLRWPARIPPGFTSDTMVAHIDVMPTLLEAAGVPIPEQHPILDGRSFLPLLERKADLAWPDRTLVIQAHRGDEPIPLHHAAVIRQRWKLVHPSGFGREKMPEDVPFELYDIPADPGEANDLASDHPEVVAELKDAYSEWFEDVSTTRPDNFAPPRIVVGTDHQSTTILTQQDWRPADPEGWGSDAHWQLTFAQDATYHIRVRWPKPVGPGILTIEAGETRATVELSEPSSEATLQGVAIPAGDAQLRAGITHEGERQDGYHVILERE